MHSFLESNHYISPAPSLVLYSEHGGLIQGLCRRTTRERILYLVFPLTLPYNLAWIELDAFFYELFIWAHTL